MKDVSFRALPLDRREIRSMIKDIRSYPLLLGIRGEARKDIQGIEEVMVKTAHVLTHVPRITDLEINPLVVYENGTGVIAVDVRVMLASGEKERS